MKRLWILAMILPLTACGGGDDDVVEQAPPKGAAASEEATDDSVEQGQILDYGVGQTDQYASGIAIVENTSDHGGQTVTVSMNFLDDAGEVITTETQVESFAYAGQKVAIHVFADLGNARTNVAAAEPTLLVEDEGTFSETEVELDPVESSSISAQFGSFSAKFPIQNPTDEPLQDLRVGVACFNAKGNIIGGTSTYPDLVPPGGQIMATVDGLTVSSKPASCTAYPSPAGF